MAAILHAENGIGLHRPTRLREQFRKARVVISLIGTLVLCLGLVSGCVYRQDVQQGNEITSEMIDQVSPGMTRREVVRELGYPLVNDPFNRDRWDYFYSYKSGRSGDVVRQSATLIFEGDSLVSIKIEIPKD